MLYIRHAEKLYDNGKSHIYPLDPGLTEQGKINAQLRFKSLLESSNLSKVELPTAIISSPYLRARETAIIARDTIYEITGKIIPLMVDNHLSEYLYFKRYQNINLETALTFETLQYFPTKPEPWQQFSKRMRKYAHENVDNFPSWYITHGTVIQAIAETYKLKIKRPHELEGICIANNNIELI